MKTNQGTPKSLKEAIRNGMTKGFTYSGFKQEMDQEIENHVKDFLGQRFTAAMMSNQTLTELWESIIRKDEP